MEKHIGCSGWFYRHWKGRFYPQKIPQSKWFKFYAENFDTVELNSTFYNFPKTSTAKNWYRTSPKNFTYTLKVNRIITHIKRFNGTETLVRDFYKVGDELQEKTGCFLFQMPPSMKFDYNKLQNIIGQLDLDKKNVLEFRHISWFNEDVYSELEKNGITFCTVSHPKFPDDIVNTSGEIYIRFHGKHILYASNYSGSDLKKWSDKIRQSKAKAVWAYFNNDFNAYAPKNAGVLRKLLSSS